MHKKIQFIGTCFALAMLSACGASPEVAAVNRAKHMEKLFPNAADRAGLHLVFPFSRSAFVSYYPDQINDAQAMSKAAKYCAASFPGTKVVKTKPNSAEKTVLGDGTEVDIIQTTIECRSS